MLPLHAANPPPGSRLLADLADLAADTPGDVRRWPLVHSAGDIAAAAATQAEAAVWPANNATAAEQACAALAEGVPLPLVLLPANAALTAHYAERWLAAGAHAVVQGR